MDYRVYRPDWRETAVVAAASCALLFAVGYVFFQHAVWSAVAMVPGIWSPALYARFRRNRRLAELTLQFQQLLHIVSSSLAAGRSVESAFRDAVGDLRLMYPHPHAMIVREMEALNHKVHNGVPVEKALADFSARSGVEDIRDFAEVLAVCKRQGGNAVDIARKAAHLIHEKLELQREIETMTAQKKWESRVLAISPLALIAFLSSASGDYMAPLFQATGRLFMLAALAVIAACAFWCVKLTDIRV